MPRQAVPYPFRLGARIANGGNGIQMAGHALKLACSIEKGALCKMARSFVSRRTGSHQWREIM